MLLIGFEPNPATEIYCTIIAREAAFTLCSFSEDAEAVNVGCRVILGLVIQDLDFSHLISTKEKSKGDGLQATKQP